MRPEHHITRRKRHSDGWRVEVRYSTHENYRHHEVQAVASPKRHKPAGEGRLWCHTCDGQCVAVSLVRELLAGFHEVQAETDLTS